MSVKYVTRAITQVWYVVTDGRPYVKRTTLKCGTAVYSDFTKGNYAHIIIPTVGYVDLGFLELTDTFDLPPTHYDGVNLFRVLHGTERPKWSYLPPNYGSFDITQLLPAAKLGKAGPIKLSAQQVQVIQAINENSQEIWAWLVDQDGNRKILSLNDDGTIRIPSPCAFGGNVVNVLERKGKFARIQTLDPQYNIPLLLPAYLLHRCYCIYNSASNPVRDAPAGSDHAQVKVYMPLISKGGSAWIPTYFLN